jgi:AcrR family transcriptional regulator
LRERNKARRRDAVLDAALELLDRTDGTPVTTERVAELAEVSPATVYNLVGTREQLLVALLDRVIADLLGDVVETAPGDPIAAMGTLVERAVAVLVARPVAHRRVVLELTAAASGDLHTRLSPATAFEIGYRRAQAANLLLDDLDPRALAMQAYLSFNGALLRWAAGALADDEFRRASLHGLATVAAAAATPRARRRLLDDLRACGEGGDRTRRVESSGHGRRAR